MRWIRPIAAMGLPLGVGLLVVAMAPVPSGVTAWHIADCNVRARDSVPSLRPRAGAAALPREAASAPSPPAPPGANGDATMSAGERATDLEGLAANRVNDEAYVVAYRTCMRQRGF